MMPRYRHVNARISDHDALPRPSIWLPRCRVCGGRLVPYQRPR